MCADKWSAIGEQCRGRDMSLTGFFICVILQSFPYVQTRNLKHSKVKQLVQDHQGSK